jgi:DNA-binding NarL/FixJ family response regulator
MDSKLRILHVDDDAIMGMEIKEFLEAEGYEVSDTVTTGLDAIQSVRSHKPDIVLMDIKLKGTMDGIETVKQMRIFCETPVIFISGYKNSGMVLDAAMIRNTISVFKPFDPQKLIKAIESFRK